MKSWIAIIIVLGAIISHVYVIDDSKSDVVLTMDYTLETNGRLSVYYPDSGYYFQRGVSASDNPIHSYAVMENAPVDDDFVRITVDDGIDKKTVYRQLEYY
jgi:hypothetical protein